MGYNKCLSNAPRTQKSHQTGYPCSELPASSFLQAWLLSPHLDSTGIYCNPSCPARHPRREQVTFFTRPEAAEEAGFRACRRCRPRETSVYELQVEMIQRACRYIETHLDGLITLADLGKEVSVSPYHLQRVFKRVVGITPRQYVEACRLGQFKARLKEGESVTTALYDAGYGSSSRLYERTHTKLGMT